MDLAATSSLLIAALDLKLVQDVIGAMRAADAAEEAAVQNPLAPPAACDCSNHIHPCPVYQNPQVVRYEPCDEACEKAPIICHWTAPIEAKPRLALIEPVAEKPSHVTPNRWIITPPWAILPWQQPAPAPAQVKVVRYTTDIVNKGSLIDVFI